MPRQGMRSVPSLISTKKQTLTGSVKGHADLCNHAASDDQHNVSQTVENDTYHGRHICKGWKAHVRQASNPSPQINARSQATLRVCSLPFVDLCPLCFKKLYLELITQYVKFTFRLRGSTKEP